VKRRWADLTLGMRPTSRRSDIGAMAKLCRRLRRADNRIAEVTYRRADGRRRAEPVSFDSWRTCPVESIYALNGRVP
jgi:hypothetical protein